MKIQIPSNFDVSILYDMQLSKNQIDQVYYLLHLVNDLPIRIKNSSTDGFTHLNSTILQTLMRNYSLYLRRLVALEVLDCDNICQPNEKSTGFRFTDKYCGGLREVELNDKKLISRIHKRNNQSEKYPALKAWFNEKLKLEIPIDQLTKLNQEVRFQKLMFENRDFFFVVDEKGQRLHTNISNLSKELRPYVTYNGQRLCNIDIVNSQPFFSLAILHSSFYEKDNECSISIYPKLNKNLLQHKISLMLGVLENGNIDIEQYKKIVLDGLLYEYLENCFKCYLNKQVVTRKEIKEMVFSVLFSSNYYNTSEAKQYFKYLFPNVMKIFEIMKQREHNKLAILLQRIESSLILDKVCARVTKERPRMPVFTIHDSVATTIGNEDYVRDVMSEECQKFIELTPQIKIELW